MTGTLRCLFICEGTSDQGIAFHIERIAADAGFTVTTTVPDFDRLERPPGGTIVEKLDAAHRLGSEYEVLAIHRDADRAGREAREQEIADGVEASRFDLPYVPVIPVTMTEAWLLLDERKIRRIAGRPNSRVTLDLPTPRNAETLRDPKAHLKAQLALASEATGRRLQTLNRRFPQNRQRLLELLDPEGPVTALPSWRAFVEDVNTAVSLASNR